MRVNFLLAIVAITSVTTGCGADATLVRDMPNGGLVTYPFQAENDILSSPARQAALRIISEKCPRGSRIVREGEIPKVSRTADRAWRDQIGSDRIWSVQFACT